MPLEQQIAWAWKRIEAWLEWEVPHVARALNPGATEEQIRAAEQALGVTFPDELRLSYLIHNGADSSAEGIENGIGIFDADEFFSLDDIVRDWQSWTDLLNDGVFDKAEAEGHDGVKSVWWNPAWIPITRLSSGYCVCVDLDPEPTGTYGQIISFWTDIADRNREFGGFLAMLEDFALKLENGEFVYSEEYACLVSLDQLSEEEYEEIERKREQNAQENLMAEGQLKLNLEI